MSQSKNHECIGHGFFCDRCQKWISDTELEWIKVTHNMPQEFVDVIIWNGINQSISCLIQDKWFHEVDWYDYDHITHWKHSRPPKE